MEWPDTGLATASATPTASTNGSLVEPAKMKIVYFGNEFPHDDLKDLFRRLHGHSKGRQHPVLSRFIDEATLAVREEVRLLPAQLKGLVPAFESLFNLADHVNLRNGPLGESINGMLLCAVQLAAFIG